MGILGKVGDWFRKGVGMMTDGDRKEQWPRESETPRLIGYQRNQRLYDGDHEAVFLSGEFEWAKENIEERDYIFTNLCWALTDLLTSREMGDGIVAEVPENAAATEFFAWLQQHCLLDQLLIDAVTDSSVLGDAFLKVGYNAQAKRITVDIVDPRRVEVELSPIDGRKMQAVNIGQVLYVDDGLKQRPYLWIERHELRPEPNGEERSWVSHYLYACKESGRAGDPVEYDPVKDRVALRTIPELAGLPDEAATGLAELLVIHLGNRQSSRAFWGRSDYHSIVRLQGSVNWRLTQRDQVLDGFVHPWITLPGEQFEIDQHGKKRAIDLSAQKVLFREVYDGDPGGVEVASWDASLAAVKDQLEDHYQQIAVTEGVDVSALMSRVEGPGNQLSGRAIALMQCRTQATVKARQRRRLPEYQRLYSIASKLAGAVMGKGEADNAAYLDWKPTKGAFVSVEPEEITISLSDGLPTDRTQDIDEQGSVLALGLQSKKRAIMELESCTEEDAQAILDEIKAEAPAPPKPAFGGTAQNMLPDDALEEEPQQEVAQTR